LPEIQSTTDFISPSYFLAIRGEIASWPGAIFEQQASTSKDISKLKQKWL
jgi:hypothetical protein